MSGRRFCEADLRTNCNLAERNEWDAERDDCNGWRNAQMRYLAKAASGFVLAIGMYVWSDLQKERERKQRERERRWPGEFAEDGMYSRQHLGTPQRSSS